MTRFGNILSVCLVFGTILKVLWQLLNAFRAKVYCCEKPYNEKISLTSGHTDWVGGGTDFFDFGSHKTHQNLQNLA